MKKLISIIVLVCISASVFAQRQHVKHLTTFDDKPLHFGFTIAVNTLDFSLEHYRPIGENPEFVYKNWGNFDGNEITEVDTVHADIAEQVPGLTVGIVTSLRLGEYFNLRFLPGLSFGERRLMYNVPVYDANSTSAEPLEYFSIKTTYIDLPLLVKYKSSRLNNQRPYLIAGPALRIDISKTGVEDLVRVKRGGFYFEAGVGWDSYLPFFRLSTELKVGLGLGNMLNDGPDGENQRQYYTTALKKLTSNVFTLSFHFE